MTVLPVGSDKNLCPNFFQHRFRNTMPTVTLRYTLPDEQGDFDAALAGGKALTALHEIDQRLRSLLKHGEPSGETGRLAQEIRDMIPGELLEL